MINAVNESSVSDGFATTTGSYGDESTLKNPNLTYRVQRLPPNFDRERTKEALTDVLALPLNQAGLEICSLAHSPDKRELVATITFKETPDCLSGAKQNSQILFTLPRELRGEETDPPIQLMIDSHFLGLTPLQAYDTDPSGFIDCIAVSGFGSNAFGSFKERGASHMWLRDSLQRDVPNLRVFLYGYDSRFEDQRPLQDVHKLGESFKREIRLMRSGQASTRRPRPFIFIAHSLGGLIVKEALIQMQRLTGTMADKTTLRSVFGALFFGVPSQVMNIDALLRMVEGRPNQQLLWSLRKGSDVLIDQGNEWKRGFRFRDSRIVFFYESRASPTAEKVGERWTMTGPPLILVDKDSATDRLRQSDSISILPINRSHSELVKFSQDDPDYVETLGLFREFAAVAVDVIGARFDEHA